MLRVARHSSLGEIPREEWNALLGPDAAPFLEWEFLRLLEDSGSAAPARGWTPTHLALRRGSELVAAAPAYVKSHFLGEFFYNDFRWPLVAARLGVRYFPKLVVAVPFSPATGPRLLVRAGEERGELVGRLAREARLLAASAGLSSAHVLFTRPEDLPLLEAEGFTAGAGVQFHWENRGERTFDEFLARFPSKKRHMIRTERAQPARDGTVIRTVREGALTPELMELVSRAYEANLEKHGEERVNLTPAFFRLAGERFRHRAEVVLAEEGGEPIAAAFNLRGERRLYGRQWGALRPRRFLHFNVCLYHSVERCLAEGLEAFEPGAGGEHKLARGFDPVLVHSAHWFAEPRLHAVLSAALRREVAGWSAWVADFPQRGSGASPRTR